MLGGVLVKRLLGPAVVTRVAVAVAVQALAAEADRRGGRRLEDAGGLPLRSIISNAWTYALSIAVYCTAWTYFGSVGRAASGGIWFLPTYLGPTLAMALAWLVVLKMIRIARTHRITSIADFVASRYGKSHLLGGLVSLRPDHDRYVLATQEAAARRQATVVVHALSADQADHAARVLSGLGADVTRTL